MNEVHAELAKIRKENPQVDDHPGLHHVDYTKQTYHAAMSALLEGSVLAVLVVCPVPARHARHARSRRWRSRCRRSRPSHSCSGWASRSTRISLLALSLVAGVLVDDAIVEIENIVRHMRMGKSGFQAALDAADEIGLAVVATCSATIIAVFLPVSFMGGLTGQYFKQFGLTVAAAVFFSLLVARLITPVHRRLHAEVRARSRPTQRRPDHGLVPARAALGDHAPLEDARLRRAFFAAVGRRSDVDAEGLRSASRTTASTGAATSSCRPACSLEDTAAVSAAAYRILARQPEVASVVEKIGGDDFGEVRTREPVHQARAAEAAQGHAAAVRGPGDQGPGDDPRRAHPLQSQRQRRRDINIYITGRSTRSWCERAPASWSQEMRAAADPARCRASTATCRARRSSSARTSTSPPSSA